jgi:hypothetical protein
MKALPAASVIAALGLLAAGCHGGPAGMLMSSGSNAAASATMVPWVDQPAPNYLPPPVPTPRAAYPDCRADQLVGSARRGGGAGGTFYQAVRVTNRSRRPCTLSGGPAAIVGLRSTGVQVTLTRTANWPSLIGPGPANLRSGQSGWLTLAYPDACNALIAGQNDDFTSLWVRLEGGGRVRVSLPAAINVVCGLEASRFGAPQHSPQARSPEATSPWNALTVTTHLPATLVAGSALHYTVTLRNHSRHNLVLSPCPSYAEYLTPVQHLQRRLVRRYFLNCRASPAIAAGASVTFAMQVNVPNVVGPTKYEWQLQGSNVVRGGVTTTEPAT